MSGATLLWFNGALMPADAVRIAPDDRGFALGDGVFETLAVRAGRPCHWARHAQRLMEGAAVLEIAGDFSGLEQAASAVIGANQIGDGVLRITLSRGRGPRGVLPLGVFTPSLVISPHPAPPAAAPARVVVAQGTRRNEHSPLSRIKALAYGDAILARQEAARAGADDALLLNTAGDLAEASAANVVLCVDGRWLTPRRADGALGGIARAVLLEAGLPAAAGGAQGTVSEARITLGDLARAEYAVLINSLGVRAVAAIDGRGLELPPEAVLAAAEAVIFGG